MSRIGTMGFTLVCTALVTTPLTASMDKSSLVYLPLISMGAAFGLGVGSTLLGASGYLSSRTHTNPATGDSTTEGCRTKPTERYWNWMKDGFPYTIIGGTALSTIGLVAIGAIRGPMIADWIGRVMEVNFAVTIVLGVIPVLLSILLFLVTKAVISSPQAKDTMSQKYCSLMRNGVYFTIVGMAILFTLNPSDKLLRSKGILPQPMYF